MKAGAISVAAAVVVAVVGGGALSIVAQSQTTAVKKGRVRLVPSVIGILGAWFLHRKI